MSKKYIIKRVDGSIENVDNVWEDIEPIAVSIFPWDDNGYRPKSEARVFYTSTHIYIRFMAYEDEIVATYTNMNEPVYKDSCVEFFINPTPNTDDRYLNFEMNPYGTLNLGIGADRYDRKAINSWYLPIFNIKSSITPETIGEYGGEFWWVEYSIPLDFLRELYKDIEFKSGVHMKGNFYKCGDDTKYSHFGCWNEVVWEEPDFHRPECFGDLILE